MYITGNYGGENEFKENLRIKSKDLKKITSLFILLDLPSIEPNYN